MAVDGRRVTGCFQIALLPVHRGRPVGDGQQLPPTVTDKMRLAQASFFLRLQRSGINHPVNVSTACLPSPSSLESLYHGRPRTGVLAGGQ